jgi:hypothetical protein
MIDKYSFGHIIINGKEYTSDVKIFGNLNHVQANWWRELGHTMALPDIQDILNDPPEVLIIGTGSAGVMKVPEKVITHIKSTGIELIIERTPEACNIFNKLHETKNVVAALHITC